MPTAPMQHQTRNSSRLIPLRTMTNHLCPVGLKCAKINLLVPDAYRSPAPIRRGTLLGGAHAPAMADNDPPGTMDCGRRNIQTDILVRAARLPCNGIGNAVFRLRSNRISSRAIGTTIHVSRTGLGKSRFLF